MDIQSIDDRSLAVTDQSGRDRSLVVHEVEHIVYSGCEVSGLPWSVSPRLTRFTMGRLDGSLYQ